MATIGQALTAPEAGWQRIDNLNANISYVGKWTPNNSSGEWAGTMTTAGGVLGSAIQFNFVGTQLRVIGLPSPGFAFVNVFIDGVKVDTYSESYNAVFQCLFYSITGLTNKEHYVQLIANDAMSFTFDAIDIDSTGTIKPYSPVISAPTNLTAKASDSKVILSWNAVTGAAGYNVKRSTTAGGPYTTVGANVSTTSYVDTAVANGTTYYYVVTAVNSTAESANSNEAFATPIVSAPINLTATSGNSQVALSWGAVNTASGYNVKRSTTAGGPYTTIATNVTGTNYLDTTVTNGTTYYYVVNAVDSNGNESANSNEAFATPQAPTGQALLRVTMIDSSEREYQLSTAEIDSFINWYTRTIGTGTTCYVLNKKIGLQNSKEYLSFDKIISFEVIPLTE